MDHRESLKQKIGLVVLTALFLSACDAPATIPSTSTPTSVPSTSTPTSVPPTAADGFPTGLFDSAGVPGYTERYSEDGTLVVYHQGREELRGKWYVEGDILHTGDTWCHDEDAMPASYKWQFDGEFLTFQLIEDKCLDRRSSVDGIPWRLIEGE